MSTVAEYFATRAPSVAIDSTLESQARLETGAVFKSCGLEEKAIFLLMMHWTALGLRTQNGTNTSVGGTIRKEKEGQLVREYMLDFSLTSKYPDLSQTSWGLELIRLRKTCTMGPRNRFTPVS